MIVDDEEVIIRSLDTIFKRVGIETVGFTNPVEAVKQYHAHKTNIVLVDVLMPQMQGNEVIKEIKKINPLCNIIVMTAFSKMEHVVECIEAGAFDYITKPFTDISILLNIVKSAVERVDRWYESFGLTSHTQKENY